MNDIYEDIWNIIDDATQEAFDIGYLEGVRAARLHPKEADMYIKYTLSLRAEQDLWDNSPSEYAPDQYDELDY